MIARDKYELRGGTDTTTERLPAETICRIQSIDIQ
jgi:hypothetical protein